MAFDTTPAPVISFLARQLDHSRHVAWIEIDRDGVVTALGGRTRYYKIENGLIGSQADVSFPHLAGMLGEGALQIVLPFVQMPNGQLADVHVLPIRPLGALSGPVEMIYAVLLDTSSEAYRLEAVQQVRNEHALRGVSPMHASLLTLLGARDALLLELDSSTAQGDVASQRLRMLSPAPPWAKTLCAPESDAISTNGNAPVHSSAAKPPDSTTSGATLAIDVFPFLEAFLPEAQQFWSSESRGLLRSMPWVQSDGASSELSLQASAVYLEGHGGLLILEVLGKTYHEKRSLLQRARERSLEQERLNRAVAHQQYMLDYISRDLAEPIQRSLIRIEELLTSPGMSPLMADVLTTIQRECQEHVDGVRKILAVFGRHTGTGERPASNG